METISPGDGLKKVGGLNISGTYAESGSGILNIDIDGTVAGTKYDVLNISGAATFGGTINIDLLTGFKPVVGMTWDVLNYSSETGSFTTIDLPTAPTGDHYVFTCGATECSLSLDSGAAGALNSVSAFPARRVSRALGDTSTVSTHEPVVILSRATCFATRMIGSASCGDETSASHGSDLHEVASAGTELNAAHNNVMVATSSVSSGRRGTLHEAPASAMAMARIYVCGYLPSTVRETMGCD